MEFGGFCALLVFCHDSDEMGRCFLEVVKVSVRLQYRTGYMMTLLLLLYFQPTIDTLCFWFSTRLGLGVRLFSFGWSRHHCRRRGDLFRGCCISFSFSMYQVRIADTLYV